MLLKDFSMSTITHLSKKSKEILKSNEFPNKIHLFDGFWSVNDCKRCPDSLFIFGDNDIKQGIGGQAIIRICANSIGIPTKKFPSYKNQAYYTDAEYVENCKKILKSIDKIIVESMNYNKLFFPMNGFGVGLSLLQVKAPKTLKFLNDMIKECFGIDYELLQNKNNKLRATIDVKKNG
jgi:hypothetical protein